MLAVVASAAYWFGYAVFVISLIPSSVIIIQVKQLWHLRTLKCETVLLLRVLLSGARLLTLQCMYAKFKLEGVSGSK